MKLQNRIKHGLPVKGFSLKMIKALLVSYPGEPINPTTFLPDNGLASLAACLIEEGYKAKILDYGTIDLFKRSTLQDYQAILSDLYQKKKQNIISKPDENKILKIDKKLSEQREYEIELIGKEINKTINTDNIDFVGFKSWMGDAYPGMLKLTEIIKKQFKDIPIIVGGPQVVSFADLMLEDGKNIDFLCYDEGEPTIVPFARYIEGKEQSKNIPNIMFIKRGLVTKNQHKVIEDLDSLPLPVYDSEIYPSIKNNQKFNMIVIDESRRCYFSCPFCLESSKIKGKWRAKSPERIVKEIQNVVDKYKIRLIRFGGQMTPRALMESISKLLIEHELNVEFSAFSHVSTMKKANFELMKKAGLYSLFFGVESGNQRMLSSTLRKRSKVEGIEDVLKRASGAGIYTVASFDLPLSRG